MQQMTLDCYRLYRHNRHTSYETSSKYLRSDCKCYWLCHERLRLVRSHGWRLRRQARSLEEGLAMARELFQKRSRREIWQEFLNDSALLARYRVTDEEIEVLKTFAPFGSITGSEDIIFILERVRRSRKRW